jgi:hypothetical protein
LPDRTEPCPTCGGDGTITVPSIETKIAYHLMNSPGMGLGLKPAEVAELGQALNLTPTAAGILAAHTDAQAAALERELGPEPDPRMAGAPKRCDREREVHVAAIGTGRCECGAWAI